MTGPQVRLRPVEDADLPIFLAHQDDPVTAHVGEAVADDGVNEAIFRLD